MTDLGISDFGEFFNELHDRPPFPWQERLAHKVCSDVWPEVIDLPTASGKTACLDVALFALALQGKAAPRRIFFVVDRRVVVNEAYLRMQDVAKKLLNATDGVLSKVATQLRNLAGGDDPLLVYEMRGGAFRDETWVKNPRQPLVITSTVDQVGSRLLFRGYGVAEHSWPLHAGLIGNDALIILDEAHCSLAFAQTLQRIEGYRSAAWADTHVGSPFRFVEMTATPSRETTEPFRLNDADRANSALQERLQAKKPTTLVEVKAKRDDFRPVVKELTDRAVQLAKSTVGKRIAVFANRVLTAKLIYQDLCEQYKQQSDVRVELVIGAMRAVDRDDLYQRRLQRLKSDISRTSHDPLTYVVSTQCLEVGADLDFDVIVTECASIDALLQRFGRLDRLGGFGRAAAAIVIASWQVDPKQPDPIYKDALSLTWAWLNQLSGGGAINMGIESGEPGTVTVAQALKGVPVRGLRLIGPCATILLPSHIDTFAQTSPIPQPDPAVELFLHGPKSGTPEVNVLWRRDLDNAPVEDWTEIVTLCPPSSRETMSVKIGVFKKWFAGEARANEFDSDLESTAQEQDPKERGTREALVWRGDQRSQQIRSVNDIRPGQTIVLRAKGEGWNELGYIPTNRPKDVGDQAAFSVRKSVSLRLHSDVIAEWPDTPARAEIAKLTDDPALEWDSIKELLTTYAAELGSSSKLWPWEFVSEIQKLSRVEMDDYPNSIAAHAISARRGSAIKKPTDYVGLKQHTDDVILAAEENSRALSGDLRLAFEHAAKYHDYGKADIRYQAWLRGGDQLAARYALAPVAKSGRNPVGKQADVGLPEGFRHELLSLIFAVNELKAATKERDLILHLVASHHGRCRPFAPVVIDNGAACVSFGETSVCAVERISLAAHRIDSGVADRFWNLTRRFGWWGLAYLEALFRLADWNASENESAAVSE